VADSLSWVQYYNAAVLVDPKHAAAWHGWGMLEQAEGNLVAARDTWIKVQSNLFKRDHFKRDFCLRGTLSFGLLALSPYKSF
jgi:hypothetical protein